jgi:hypothetical protein
MQRVRDQPGKQLEEANQIVGCLGKVIADGPGRTNIPRPYNLSPTEGLLNALPNALIGRTAGVTRSAALDRRAAPALHVEVTASHRLLVPGVIVCGRWYAV